MFERKKRGFREIFERVVKGALEYDKMNEATARSDSAVGVTVRWAAPPEGVYKVNTYAAMFEGKQIGLGGVVIDFEGDVVVAMCSKLDGIDNVDVSEALSARQGIQIAIQPGFTNLMVEVDSM